MEQHKWTQVLATEKVLRDAGLQLMHTQDTGKDDITKIEAWGPPEAWFALLGATPDVVMVNPGRLAHLDKRERECLRFMFAADNVTLSPITPDAVTALVEACVAALPVVKALPQAVEALQALAAIERAFSLVKGSPTPIQASQVGGQLPDGGAPTTERE